MSDWADVTVANADDFAAADGFVVLDTAKLPRCNVMQAVRTGDWAQGRPLLNIDHHGTNDRFGVNFRLRYNYQPGDDLYVVVNAFGEGPDALREVDRSIVVKFTRSFDF